MIDLCIDARMASHAGIGVCIRQLVPLFNHPPFRVILIVSEHQKWAEGMEQIFDSAGIYSIREQLFLPLKIPSSDLFWSPHYNIPLFPIRAKKRIVTIHDVCHLALSHLFSPLEQIYAKFVMHAAMHKSDRVVTVSFFSREELQRYFGQPKNGLKVIPIAVDKDRFHRILDPNAFSQMEKKYRLPKKFVLFVGNIKPHKNLKVLLKAFEKVPLPDWGLVVAGRNRGLRNSVEEIQEGRIFIIGEVPDVDLPILYSMAQSFVFPSLYEGFGLPPLEAMSCGCPTIVSNVASMPEVCGDASLYIHPDRPEELTEAILRIATEDGLSEDLVKKGYQRVKSFDWERTAEQYRELFEEVHFAKCHCP